MAECPNCKEQLNPPKMETCTPSVIEVNNGTEVVVFHTIEVPIPQTEEEFPMSNGRYKNTLVKFPSNGHVYLYNSDGMPIWLNEGGSFDSLLGRPMYDGVEMTHATNIPNVTTLVATETAARIAADTAEATARETGDNALRTSLTAETSTRVASDATLQSNITAEASTRTANDTALGNRIDAEATARAYADDDLQDSIDTEITNRATADTTLDNKIDQEIEDREFAITDLSGDLTTETQARIAADNTKADKTTIDKVVMTDFTVSNTPSTTTITLDKAKQNILSGTTSTASIALPVASHTQAGVMNSAIYDSIQDNSANIDAVLNGAVSISGISASPTQSELTTAWQTATQFSTVINGAKINDPDNQKVWTYYTNTTTWYAASNTTQVTVSPWTNTTAGIVKGSTTDGQIFAESNGTGSVNGWDDLVNDVTDNTADIATLQTAVNGKEPAITAGGQDQYWRGDKTWATFPSIPDSTSDLTNDSNFVSDANYVHTDNNYTTAEKTKLAGVAAGAEVNVQSNWTETDTTADSFIQNKPTLSTVATTGDYTDLSNTPTVPVITMTTTDPGEGSVLAANTFIAVYEA